MSREEGKRTRTEQSRCRGGSADLCQVQLGMLSNVQQVQAVRAFTSNNHPAKSPEWRFSPPQKQHGVSAADCPNAILEKPRIHPQELCLDICCCRLALIAAAPRGPPHGPRPRVGLAPGKNPDTFQRLYRGREGGRGRTGRTGGVLRPPSGVAARLGFASCQRSNQRCLF